MKSRALLDALSNRRVFVLYRLVPRDSGKTDKIPSDPRTGVGPPEFPELFGINAQDPAQQMSGDEALLWADTWNAQRPPGVLGYGVGLVISADSGLWCLDLDNCRDGDGWQPHVQNFVARFPGAYVEVSVSGTGVHVFGSYVGAAPVHGTRNKAYRAELYTRLRFIAITGEGASGNILSDCTTQLAQFAEQFFPPHGDADHGHEWTDKPVDTWRGPEDDDVLIARALRSTSANAVFSGRASFSDLWDANADALARSFPSQNSHSAWDGSAADQALANHLAFWSGNNCERMLRLMRASRLVRPKWDRIDYMRSTILRACGDQREWYIERQQPEVSTAAAPAPPATQGVTPPPPATVAVPVLKPGERPPPGSVVTIFQQKQMFDGMCWVEDIRKIQQPDGYVLGKEQFDIAFAGRMYITTPDGQRPSKSAWEAFTANEAFDFPQVNTQCFDPSQPTGIIRVREGRREINSYKPAQIPRLAHTAESIAPFTNFARTLLPHGDDALILLSFMSACTRFLGAKFAWCPFVQGVKGNGKTTLARVFEYCISQRYTHWAKSSELHEKFNSVFVEKLLLIVDETRTQDQTELQEILKLYVTSKRIEVRPMYAEKLMKDVCFNMFLLSNHQNGVRIDKDERRFAPLYCAQQEKGDLMRDKLTADYFIDFNHWLEADGFPLIYDYLMTFDIPSQYNPAGACTTAPITTSTEQALVASLGGIEQEVLSAVEQKREGFRNGWISSIAVDHLLAQLGKDKVVPRNARSSMVLGLGYIPHPSLKNGGLCDVGMADGTMPRLYVTKGHAWAVDYLSAAQVRDGYLEAQRK